MADADTLEIVGGNAATERAIRAALRTYPDWFVRSARVARIEVTSQPQVAEQIAVFEHGSRVLYVATGVGDVLRKAIGHELAHGMDDWSEEGRNPHMFTSLPEWRRIHREQEHFDIAKYRDEPLEYFADMVVKYLMLGDKLQLTNPHEVQFIAMWVFPFMQQRFGAPT